MLPWYHPDTPSRTFIWSIHKNLTKVYSGCYRASVFVARRRSVGQLMCWSHTFELLSYFAGFNFSIDPPLSHPTTTLDTFILGCLCQIMYTDISTTGHNRITRQRTYGLHKVAVVYWSGLINISRYQIVS